MGRLGPVLLMGPSGPPRSGGHRPTGARNAPGSGLDVVHAEGTMSVKKVLTWLVIAFALFYVIQAPEASAQLVRSAGNALGDAAQSLAAFVGSLV